MTQLAPNLFPGTVGVGLMCRSVRSSGFKVALVVGYPSATTHGDKLRVRVWRAATKRWTDPVLVERDKLTMLVEADYKKHKATIKHAAAAALAAKYVARVWS